MNDLYKGYVITKNKKSTQKFGNGARLLTLEQVKNSPEYAGVLADDVVLIDVDDKQQSEKLMDIVEALQIDCRVYQTTRGKHFLFRDSRHKITKCSTGTKLACGLKADIKCGSKNSYEVIKFGGEDRFIEWDFEKELSELPAFLLPIKTDIDLLNLKAGDGRNQALFSYILVLAKYGLKKEEIKGCIRIINDYILADKLPESELDVILRDEAFPKTTDSTGEFFTSKGSFLFDKFAQFLIKQYNIVKIFGQLHIYDNGVYKWGAHDIQAQMIQHIPNLNKQKRNEVMAYLDLLVPNNTKLAGAEYVAFNNGIYDIETGVLLDFDSKLIITNKVPHNYNPKAYSKIADTTLNKLACNDKEIRCLLEEVIGYVFYRRNELRKAFILTGDKANGKSTFLNMITNVLGGDNVSSLDLSELGDRFKTAELFGKLANIGDDIGDEFIPNPAIFKKVVSGDRVNAERKGQDPFDFASYAKMLFSANSIPRIKDKSGAVIDRLIIVPFNATFDKNDPDYDPYIKYKLQTEEVMEYLIRIGIEGLGRVLKNREFTITEQIKENIKEYEQSNSPVLLFFDDLSDTDVYGQQTKYVYQKYGEFCISNNFQQMSNVEFGKKICKRFDCIVKIMKIEGKSVRVYSKRT